MRWPAVLILAAAPGGAPGCAGAGPEGPLCTATSSLVRRASFMSGRRLPVETWAWDAGGLASRMAFAYDADGRLVEQEIDSGPGPGPTPSTGSGPDGRANAVISTAYTATSAEVTFTDLVLAQARRVALYAFDEAGRTLRIERMMGPTRELAVRQYAPDGRVLREDTESYGPSSTKLERHEYSYGPNGRAVSRRSTVDGAVSSWTYQYEEAPGRVTIRSLREGALVATHRYEHDADGRMTRAEVLQASPEHSYQIAYGDDGAVAILRSSGDVFTYSAACGVVLEVPRRPTALAGPRPDGHYELPSLPRPF